MSFEITRGIAAYDCPDHYAILGVTLDASAGEIRKRYLRIARSLHPDTRVPGADAKEASTLLSKQVNPAYEALSQDKSREEYRLLIRIVSQRVVMESDQKLQSEKAKELLKASDFQSFYHEAVADLAKTQYKDLGHVQSVVEQLSELNLAFLLRQEGATASPSPQRFATSKSVSVPTQPSAPAPTPPPSAPNASVTPPTPPPVSKPPVGTFVTQYVRRAEDLIAKNRFPQAIQELRDGLKLDPQNSQCQSLLGTIYLKQNKTTMAKIHFQQALKLDAGDVAAIKGMEKIAKLDKANKATQGSNTQNAKDTSGRKGLFGLFGGKK